MKRYEIYYDYMDACCHELEEDEGRFILYSDAEKLEKRVKELEELVEFWSNASEELADLLMNKPNTHP